MIRLSRELFQKYYANYCVGKGQDLCWEVDLQSCGSQVDLYKVYDAVANLGGHHLVSQLNQWDIIFQAVTYTSDRPPGIAQATQGLFDKHLKDFVQHLEDQTKAGVQIPNEAHSYYDFLPGSAANVNPPGTALPAPPSTGIPPSLSALQASAHPGPSVAPLSVSPPLPGSGDSSTTLASLLGQPPADPGGSAFLPAAPPPAVKGQSHVTPLATAATAPAALAVSPRASAPAESSVAPPVLLKMEGSSSVQPAGLMQVTPPILATTSISQDKAGQAVCTPSGPSCHRADSLHVPSSNTAPVTTAIDAPSIPANLHASGSTTGLKHLTDSTVASLQLAQQGANQGAGLHGLPSNASSAGLHGLPSIASSAGLHGLPSIASSAVNLQAAFSKTPSAHNLQQLAPTPPLSQNNPPPAGTTPTAAAAQLLANANATAAAAHQTPLQTQPTLASAMTAQSTVTPTLGQTSIDPPAAVPAAGGAAAGGQTLSDLQSQLLNTEQQRLVVMRQVHAFAAAAAAAAVGTQPTGGLPNLLQPSLLNMLAAGSPDVNTGVSGPALLSQLQHLSVLNNAALAANPAARAQAQYSAQVSPALPTLSSPALPPVSAPISTLLQPAAAIATHHAATAPNQMHAAATTPTPLPASAPSREITVQATPTIKLTFSSSTPITTITIPADGPIQQGMPYATRITLTRPVVAATGATPPASSLAPLPQLAAPTKEVSTALTNAPTAGIPANFPPNLASHMSPTFPSVSTFPGSLAGQAAQLPTSSPLAMAMAAAVGQWAMGLPPGLQTPAAIQAALAQTSAWTAGLLASLQPNGLHAASLQQPGMNPSSLLLPGMDPSTPQPPGMNPSNLQPPGMNPSNLPPPGMNPSSLQQPGMNPSSLQPPGMNPSNLQPPGMNPSHFPTHHLNPNFPMSQAPPFADMASALTPQALAAASNVANQALLASALPSGGLMDPKLAALGNTLNIRPVLTPEQHTSLWGLTTTPTATSPQPLNPLGQGLSTPATLAGLPRPSLTANSLLSQVQGFLSPDIAAAPNPLLSGLAPATPDPSSSGLLQPALGVRPSAMPANLAAYANLPHVGSQPLDAAPLGLRQDTSASSLLLAGGLHGLFPPALVSSLAALNNTTPINPTGIVGQLPGTWPRQNTAANTANQPIHTSIAPPDPSTFKTTVQATGVAQQHPVSSTAAPPSIPGLPDLGTPPPSNTPGNHLQRWIAAQPALNAPVTPPPASIGLGNRTASSGSLAGKVPPARSSTPTLQQPQQPQQPPPQQQQQQQLPVGYNPGVNMPLSSPFPTAARDACSSGLAPYTMPQPLDIQSLLDTAATARATPPPATSQGARSVAEMQAILASYQQPNFYPASQPPPDSLANNTMYQHFQPTGLNPLLQPGTPFPTSHSPSPLPLSSALRSPTPPPDPIGPNTLPAPQPTPAITSTELASLTNPVANFHMPSSTSLSYPIFSSHPPLISMPNTAPPSAALPISLPLSFGLAAHVASYALLSSAPPLPLPIPNLSPHLFQWPQHLGSDAAMSTGLYTEQSAVPGSYGTGSQPQGAQTAHGLMGMSPDPLMLTHDMNLFMAAASIAGDNPLLSRFPGPLEPSNRVPPATTIGGDNNPLLSHFPGGLDPSNRAPPAASLGGGDSLLSQFPGSLDPSNCAQPAASFSQFSRSMDPSKPPAPTATLSQFQGSLDPSNTPAAVLSSVFAPLAAIPAPAPADSNTLHPPSIRPPPATDASTLLPASASLPTAISHSSLPHAASSNSLNSGQAAAAGPPVPRTNSFQYLSQISPVPPSNAIDPTAAVNSQAAAFQAAIALEACASSNGTTNNCPARTASDAGNMVNSFNPGNMIDMRTEAVTGPSPSNAPPSSFPMHLRTSSSGPPSVGVPTPLSTIATPSNHHMQMVDASPRGAPAATPLASSISGDNPGQHSPGAPSRMVDLADIGGSAPQMVRVSSLTMLDPPGTHVNDTPQDINHAISLPTTANNLLNIDHHNPLAVHVDMDSLLDGSEFLHTNGPGTDTSPLAVDAHTTSLPDPAVAQGAATAAAAAAAQGHAAHVPEPDYLGMLVDSKMEEVQKEGRKGRSWPGAPSEHPARGSGHFFESSLTSVMLLENCDLGTLDNLSPIAGLPHVKRDFEDMGESQTAPVAKRRASQELDDICGSADDLPDDILGP